MRLAPVLFLLGAPCELLYYWYETSQGYWDSLPLRIFLFLSIASLVFVDSKKAKVTWRIVHWEAVLFFVFSFQSTFALLHNKVNSYYFSSQTSMFFILGMLAKAWMVPVHLFIGCGFTTLFFFWLNGWDHKLLMDSIPAQVNSLFCGIISASIMLLLESYNRKMTEAKVALTKAEEERNKALEMAGAYEQLKKHQEVIKVYVRPSLFEELASGKDPLTFQPIMLHKAVMFCDIRGFTYLTEVLTPYEKQTFLNQYFTLMNHAIVKNEGEVDKIVGDCIMGLFPNGRSAVYAALAMRKSLHTFNNMMYTNGRRKIPNGIGIAKGEVMLGNFGSNEKLDRTVIGEAVNIASRLESKTKMYEVEIVVTEDVIEEMPDYPYKRWIDNAMMKGSTRPLKLYEVYGHQPQEVIDYKEKTKAIFEKALNIYFAKGFKDALRMFKAMLDQVPPHKYKAGKPMDNILNYYIEHCEAWSNDSQSIWEKRQTWNGIHEFQDK